MEKARGKLRERREALDKLNEKAAGIMNDIAALEIKISEATKAFANGDEAQRKILAKLEAQKRPLSHRMKGLETLAQEASDAVKQAEQDFQEARVVYEEELRAYIATREKEEHQKMIAGLPERKRQIVQLYVSFCEALGQFQLDSINLQNGKVDLVQEITDFTSSLIHSLTNGVRSKGLRPLMQPGYSGNIPLWSLFAPDAEVTARFGTGIGPLNGRDIQEIRRAKRLKAFEEEFKAKQKG